MLVILASINTSIAELTSDTLLGNSLIQRNPDAEKKAIGRRQTHT